MLAFLLTAGVLQMIVISTITRRHRDIFDKHKGHGYFVALGELHKAHPISSIAIRACYVAYFLEIAFMIFSK